MPRARIAKSGGSVFDDPKNLVLDTNQTSLMVLYDVELSSSATEYTHNLGYYPVVFAFFQSGSIWYPAGAYPSGYSNIKQDTNKVYIENNTGGNVRLLISGNAVDNQIGGGKSTATGRMKVAKPGYNAATETDIRRFQFCSSADLFKKDESLRGTVTLTSNADYYYESETYITHNLGYVPVAFAIDFAGVTGDGGELPLTWADGLNDYYYYITSTRIYFGVSIFAKDPVVESYTFRYQIYRNKLA